MLFVTLLFTGLLTVAFVWSLRDAVRRPRRYERLYDEVRRTRVHAWVWGISLAALVGAALGGGGEDVLGVIAVVGFAAGYVCTRFIANAAMNRRPHDFFDQ